MDRRLFSDDDVARIHRGALRVLAEMGLRVENRACLEALERFGARVDYTAERALMPQEVVERAIALAKAQNPGWQRSFERASDFTFCGGDGSCPFYYREDQGGRRQATEADCLEAYQIVEALGVDGSGAPVVARDVPVRYAAIRMLELGLTTLNRTRLSGTDLFWPEQVPFAAELGRLYTGDAGYFLETANCITTPLTIGKTIADLAVAKAAYPSVPYLAPPMPVMGANAPLSPAGTAVVGVAEILGSYALAKALNPETPVWALALCSLMDMRGGHLIFCAPEVLAADLAICETLECAVGLPCRAFGGYCDAKIPGVQAMRDKLFRNLGLALYTQLTGFSGALDQGKVYSPTQMVLDQDLQRFVAQSFREQALDDEALAVEEIIEVGWDHAGYLSHPHTRKHMREMWRSPLFGRPAGMATQDELLWERELLERAQALWRDALARYEGPNHPEEYLREVRAISARARAALA